MSALSPLPFPSPFAQTFSKDSMRSGKVDTDVILQAMRDLSGSHTTAVGGKDPQVDRRRAMVFSHHQRSERLLQHCSSWTQLQDTLDDRVILEQQGTYIIV